MMRNDSDPGIDMKQTSTACPEQYQGTVDGNYAYFRLRNSWWQFTLSNEDEGVVFSREGTSEEPFDGVMEDAPRFIRSLVEEYRDGVPVPRR